jgi:hypothetical protein
MILAPYKSNAVHPQVCLLFLLHSLTDRTKMRAARYYGVEDIRVEEIEEPVCNEGQLKIKPAFVGICGTGMSHQ